MPRLKALSQQVQALFGQGRYVEARALYTQILADSPDSISAPQHTYAHARTHIRDTHPPHALSPCLVWLTSCRRASWSRRVFNQ